MFIKGTKYHNVPEDIEYMSVSYGEDKKLSVGVSEFLSNYNTSVIVYLTESEYNYDDKTKAKISVYEKKIT